MVRIKQCVILLKFGVFEEKRSKKKNWKWGLFLKGI